MHLIVAEKHNAAKRIASILSGGSATGTKKNGAVVYEWGNNTCLGLAGHVVEVDFVSEYSDWGSVHPQQLVQAEITKRITKKNLVGALHSLAKEADRVTIAMDFDREGELIGKEAYDLVRRVSDTVPIDRVRFSSLTQGEVRKAFDDPTELDFQLAAAGEARQVIDLRWGASLTRFLTLSAETGQNQLISVGRVQTPTLKLLVDKEREIENFDPDDYWEIYADVSGGGSGSQPFETQYYYREDGSQQERLFDEDVATGVYEDIECAPCAVVKDVSESTQRDNPPIPFNTTEFIKAANAIDYDAKPAMNLAESLYDEGYITYPRTENTVYPDDLDPVELLTSLADISEFGDAAQQVVSQDELSPTSGDKETTDHPPIHPTTAVPTPQAVSEREWEIYELIVRRFCATYAPHATWDKVRVDLEANGRTLKANGKRLADPGYHSVYPYFENSETEIPVVDEGDELSIEETRLEEKQTQPPNRLGQSRLIEKMEEHGLGTKSTRHNIIDKLYERDYVDGSPPTPTPLARAVISAIEEYAPRVGSVEMTSELETDMTRIADGELPLADVTDESAEMLDSVFTELRGEQGDIGEHIADKIDVAESVGECPDCGSALYPRSTSDGSNFIGCAGYPECETLLPLPNKGRVHLLDEACDTHGLQKVKMIAGKQTFVFGCPQCRQEEADDTPDRVLGECPECHGSHGGRLAIKRVQSGSRLVGCDRYPDCEYSLPLPREGEIEVTDEMCSEHDLPELVVQKEDSSPWNLGCPICNYEEFAG